MKKITIFCLISLMMLIGSGLMAQNVLTVSSDQDSGTGTLRQLIADATAGDSIVIPGNYVIILTSELSFDKNLRINGQGATIQVAEPGVSAIRIFTITSTNLTSAGLYNLVLKGGNVQGRHATASNILNCGGTILIDVPCNFIFENVSFLDSKGTYAGAFQQNNTGTSTTLKSCTFTGNSSINNAGAIYNKGTMILTDCLFSNNSTTHNGSAIVTNKNLNAENCNFTGNIASITTNGSYGGVIFNTNNSAIIGLASFKNCIFANNTAEARGAAIFGQSGGTTTTTDFTNCTFYNNISNVEASVTSNNAGSIFTSYAGITNFINCTITGNISKLNGIAFIRDLNTVQVNFINTIIAYNYVGENINDLTNNGAGIVYSNYSIIGSSTGTISNNNPVSFTYTPQSSLFSQYTTTGVKKPLLHEDGTVKLSGQSSVAYQSGVQTLAGYTIPTLDQIGIARDNPPCLGAVEYVVSTKVDKNTEINLTVFPNPATDVLYISGNISISRVEIIDLSGKKVLCIDQPTNTVPLNGISGGMYIVRISAAEGQILKKITIK